MNLKPLAGLLLLFLLIAPALAADTEVVKVWEQNMAPHDVTSVDTDEAGTNTYYGLSNGSVGAYSAAGISQWITLLNGSIRKVKKSSYAGYLVAMTSLNETYLLDSTSGTILAYAVGIPTRDNWIRDADINRDGMYWSVTFDNSTYLYHDKVSVAANITPFSRTYYGAQSWLNASLDPHADYVVLTETANTSTRLFRVKLHQGFPYALNDTPTLYQWFYNTWLYRAPLDMTGAAGNKQFNVTFNASDAANPATVYIPYGHALPTLGDLRVTADDATTLEYNKTDIISSNQIVYYIEPYEQPKNETWYPRNVTMDYTTQYPGFGFLADGRGYLFGGGPARGIVLRTADTGLVGEGWDIINNTLQLIQNTGSGTVFNNNLYYMTDAGIPWRSLDGGAIWVNNTTGTGAAGGPRIIGNNTPQKIFMLTGTTVYTSPDGDCYTITNETAFIGVASVDYAPTAINPLTGEMWIIPQHGVTPKKVYYSGTDGNVWTIVNATFAPTGTQDAGLVWAGDELIYAGGTFPASNAWYNSSDGGVTWQQHAAAAWTTRYALGMAYNTTSGKTYIAGGTVGADGVWDLTRTSTGFGYQKNWSLVNVKKPIDGDYRNYAFYGNKSAVSNSTTTIYDTTQLTGTIGAEEPNSTLKYLTYNSSVALSGTAQTQSIPESGGVVTVGTTTNVTTLTIDDSGFTAGFTIGASSGNSKVIVAADSATFVVDGRALGINIYDITGVLKGSYTSGGTIRGADISEKTALYIVAGGDDGKVYIFSKDLTSSWVLYYTGDSMDPILTTAMSMRGEYAAVGRTGGSYEYYSLQSAVAAALSGSQTNWYSPHQVSLKIVDFWGKQMAGANVLAYVNGSSFPHGTEWLKSIYGINSTAANEMLNGTLIMSGRTDSEGEITFTMHSSLEYNITVAHPDLITSSIMKYPREAQYTIYVTPITSTKGNSTQIQFQNTSLYVSEPDINHVTFNFVYQDNSGLTDDVVWNVTCHTNGSVMYAKRWAGHFLPMDKVQDNFTVTNRRGEEWLFMYNSTRSAAV